MDARSVRRRGQVYVVLAALAWSSAGVLQRELSVGTATQVGGRALFALPALLTFVAFSGRGGVVRAFASIGRAELAVAACPRSLRQRSSSRSTTPPSRTFSSCRRWHRSPPH
jgi:hypothetical protein